MSDDLSIPNPDYRGSRAGRYGTGQGRIRQGMDPDTRRLVLFAGGLGAVLAVLIGASALTARHASEVPVVTADPRPVREKPLNPGGMKVDAAENDVFSGVSDTGSAKLAPAAETPDTKGLHSPAAPAAAAPASTAATSPPVVPSPPATFSTGNRTPAATGTAIAPAPASSAAAVGSSAPKPALGKAAAAEAHPAPPAHQPMVQLAALASEDAAHAEWAQLAKKLPELVNGRQPNFSRIERDGHVFWRVRTGGFADIAQARSFCEKMRAKSAGCSVADF